MLGAAGAWLGVKVLTVRDELTAAQGLVAGLQGGDLTETLNGLAGHGEPAQPHEGIYPKPPGPAAEVQVSNITHG